MSDDLVNRPAEQRLLAACMQDSNLLDRVVDKLSPGDFHDDRLGAVFSAIARVALRSTPTPTTVVEELRSSGELDGAGGDRGINYLATLKVTEEEATEAAKTIRDLATKREQLSTAYTIAGHIREGRDAGAEISKLSEGASDNDTWEDLAGIVEQIFEGTHKRLEPTILRRTDGADLLYEGRLNWISAPPESMKSWLAKYACVQQMQKGRPAVYIDCEENDGTTCAERIFSIATAEGVTKDQLRDWLAGPLNEDGTRDPDRRLFHYKAESGAGLGGKTRAQTIRLVKNRQVGLVVLDGFAAAISAHNPPLNEDSARDVNMFLAGLIWPIVSAGAGVLIIDHDAKGSGAAGTTSFQQRSARGSGAKLAAVSGVMIKATVQKAGSAWQPGEVELWLAKDRPGRVKVTHRSGKRLVGLLVSTPLSDGTVESTRIEIKSPDQIAEEAEAKRWDLIAAEKVSDLLVELKQPTSKQEVKELLNERRKERGGNGWRGETLVAAIRFLTENGWASVEKDGRSEMMSSVKAYLAEYGERHAADAPAASGTGWPQGLDGNPF